jgi:N-acetylmuramoyl-L-alanine amidase
MAKKILLISGHGAGDSGATAKINGKTYKEADEAIVMVKKIKSALAPYNATVDLYPTNRNAYEDAKAGKLKKDLSKYDYILEIHFNACVNDLKGDGKTTGTEAYVTTSDTSIKTEKYMVSNLAALGFRNRGVKSHNWTVINRAKIAGADSCLLEVCFIDDADDMKIYLKSKDGVASNIALGLVTGLGLKKKSNKKKKVATLCVGARVKIKAGAIDENTKKEYSKFVYTTVYTVIYIKDGCVAFGLNGVATGRTKIENITLV